MGMKKKIRGPWGWTGDGAERERERERELENSLQTGVLLFNFCSFYQFKVPKDIMDFPRIMNDFSRISGEEYFLRFETSQPYSSVSCITCN